MSNVKIRSIAASIAAVVALVLSSAPALADNGHHYGQRKHGRCPHGYRAVFIGHTINGVSIIGCVPLVFPAGDFSNPQPRPVTFTPPPVSRP